MMTAYNGINGTPCNFNHEVNEIVKGEWGMDGFVVGDAGDVLGTVMDHHYVDSYAEAVAGSIKAGIDSITDDQPVSQQALRDALERGLLSEADWTVRCAIRSASAFGLANSIPRSGIRTAMCRNRSCARLSMPRWRWKRPANRSCC
ncbi:hypothetical protein HMSSN036_42900 [Paenibacillus macerans]|nr:hypothetical protein HMSSN036_42900 [Paenibacillus macerans]